MSSREFRRTWAYRGGRRIDTFKAGRSRHLVTGVATSVMATLDVLRQAVAAKRNLIITHEPTFYTGTDEAGPRAGDPVYLAKRAFIDDHRLVVWRFSDHWLARQPGEFTRAHAAADLEPFANVAGDGANGRLREGEESLVGWIASGRPAERVGQRPREFARLAREPVIGEPPDDQAVLVDEGPFCQIDRVIRPRSWFVRAGVERGFVGDDEVPLRRHRLAQDIERRHHARCHAGDDGVGISGLERVDRLLPPRYAYLRLNSRDDIACGHPLVVPSVLAGRPRTTRAESSVAAPVNTNVLLDTPFTPLAIVPPPCRACRIHGFRESPAFASRCLSAGRDRRPDSRAGPNICHNCACPS